MFTRPTLQDFLAATPVEIQGLDTFGNFNDSVAANVEFLPVPLIDFHILECFSNVTFLMRLPIKIVYSDLEHFIDTSILALQPFKNVDVRSHRLRLCRSPRWLPLRTGGHLRRWENGRKIYTT